MTTVVYRQGRLLTDTKLTVLKSKDEVEQLLNSLLVPEVITQIPSTAHNARLYKEYIGDDLVFKLPEPGGKYIEFDDEHQFDYTPGNPTKAIAFAGNMALLPGLVDAAKRGFTALKHWWEEYVNDTIWLIHNGLLPESEIQASLMEIMFITKNGAYIWQPSPNEDGNRLEYFHDVESEYCIGMGSGMSYLMDFAIGVADTDIHMVKLDEKFPTMESLIERAARYDNTTGGEIAEFIYTDKED